MKELTAHKELLGEYDELTVKNIYENLMFNMWHHDGVQVLWLDWEPTLRYRKLLFPCTPYGSALSQVCLTYFIHIPSHKRYQGLDQALGFSQYLKICPYKQNTQS